jgi:hypothetical protein
MGWGRYFLMGDIGQQLDLQDRQREVDQLRGQMNAQWSRDRSQDEQIQTLRHENQELKLYVASLVKLLRAKGIVTEQEIADIVTLVDGPAPA